MADLPYHFTEREMNQFRETLRDSPLRFVKCDHGHPVDSYLTYWYWHQLLIMENTPLVRLPCKNLSCRQCGRDGYEDKCKVHGFIGVPPEPGTFVARGYPRHTSDEWRANAKALPRFDGIYRTRRATGEFIIGVATDNIERCLLFTDNGEVLQFDVEYRTGLLSARRFNKELSDTVHKFDNSKVTNVRGLYTVAGNQLVCYMRTPTDETYEYEGTLKDGAGKLKLRYTKHGIRPSKHKTEFSFYKF